MSDKSGDSVLFTQSFTADGKANPPVVTEEIKSQEKGETASEATNESPKTSEKEEPTNSTDEDSLSKIEKMEKKLHFKQLDLIENVLDTYSPENARKFFEENEDVAEVANKSKRLKERYRALMEEKTEPVKSAEKPVKVKDAEEGEEIIDEVAFTDRIRLNLMRGEKEAYQKETSREFAERNGLNVDDVKTLHEAASALEKATGQSFESCLNGALVSMKGSKSKSTINMPNSVGSSVPSTNDSEINRLMQTHGVNRSVAEKFYNSSKGYSGALDERITL